jgi:hypothetical protein
MKLKRVWYRRSRVVSDNGFFVDVRPFARHMLYVEGDRSFRVVTSEAGPRMVSFWMDPAENWIVGGATKAASDQDRARIRENLIACIKFLGWDFEEVVRSR